jgi:hypothetical protein
MTKFYVIEKTNTSKKDTKSVVISTIPALHNSSEEECIQGWCGTTQNICVNAHGVFKTLELAQEFIEKKFPEVSDTDEIGEEFESDDEDVVAVYQQI